MQSTRMGWIGRYIRALWRNIGPAAFDVSFIAAVSLIPLVLARLTPLINRKEIQLNDGWLWQLLTSGQLAFYALGTLAAIALVVYRGEVLPNSLRLMFGALTLLFILFIAYLIGVDPSLANARLTFVGATTFWIYIITQAMAVAVSSFDKFGLGSALLAGDESAQRTKDDLASRREEDNA